MKVFKYKEYVNETTASDTWMDEIDKFSIRLAKLEKWVDTVQTKQQHDVENWGYSYAMKAINDTLDNISKDLEKMDKGTIS